MSSSLTLFLLLLLTVGLNQPVQGAKTRTEQNVCQKQVPAAGSNQPTAPLELFNRLCFNLELPYETILLPDYVPELNFTTSDEVVAYMNRWRGARLLPRCWPHLQAALCSVLMPRYHEDHLTKTSHVHRPSVELCNDVVHKSNCQFIERHFGWPPIFQCNDTNLYARNCSNELREIKAATAAASVASTTTDLSSTCLYPLVTSADSNSWFRDVKGCSMHCKAPVFNQLEQRNLSYLVKLLSLLGLLLTSAAMVLFEVNHNISRTSQIAIVIKQCNIYKFLEYLGWSLQLLGDFACNPNGSQLSGLPLVNNACILSFALIYISSNLFLFWFVHLAKLCYLKLLGKNRESPDRATKIDQSLSLVSYIVVGFLFISVLSLAQIEGHGLYGICVVGGQSVYTKILFDFAPAILGVLYSNFYFLTTIIKLIPVEKSPRLKRNYYRIIALALIGTLDVILKLGIYLYNHINQPEWDRSVDEYLSCSINLKPLYDMNADASQPQECVISAKPLTVLYFFEVLTRLTSGLVVASWAFCGHNFRGFLRKLFDQLENDREKQKRVMRYINANETYAGNGYIRPQEIKDTYHDLVDMTSPTRTQAENNMELDADNNLRRFKSTEIPSSLGSVSLTEVSVANRRHHKHQLSQNCRTSRDVVNEARRIHAGEQMNVGQQVNANLLAGQFALLHQLAMIGHPPTLVPNFGGSKTSLNSLPQLDHEMRGYK